MSYLCVRVYNTGTSTVVAYSPAAQVCHLDTTEVMLFADQLRRSLGGAAAYGFAIDPGGVTALQSSALAQPPVISCIEAKGPAERSATSILFSVLPRNTNRLTKMTFTRGRAIRCEVIIMRQEAGG